jgi:hypothetical protein
MSDAETRLPRWLVAFLLWGSSALGMALLAVLLYVWHGTTSRVDAVEARNTDQDTRLQVLETRVPLQINQVTEDAARTRKVVEQIAAKLNVTVSP